MRKHRTRNLEILGCARGAPQFALRAPRNDDVWRRHLTPHSGRVTTRRQSTQLQTIYTSRHNTMSFNTFGHMFRVTTFGESHGVAIGCVVDGCPPGIPLEVADIQAYLDKRKPGQSRFTTQRREADEVRILSGVFADNTTRRQVQTG